MKRSGAGNGTITVTGASAYYGSLMGISFNGTPSAAINNNGANPWVFGQVTTSDEGDFAVWEIAFRGSSGKRFQSFWKG